MQTYGEGRWEEGSTGDGRGVRYEARWEGKAHEAADARRGALLAHRQPRPTHPSALPHLTPHPQTNTPLVPGQKAQSQDRRRRRSDGREGE
eukprot:738097-Rhodomonas_salina.1